MLLLTRADHGQTIFWCFSSHGDSSSSAPPLGFHFTNPETMYKSSFANEHVIKWDLNHEDASRYWALITSDTVVSEWVMGYTSFQNMPYIVLEIRCSTDIGPCLRAGVWYVYMTWWSKWENKHSTYTQCPGWAHEESESWKKWGDVTELRCRCQVMSFLLLLCKFGEETGSEGACRRVKDPDKSCTLITPKLARPSFNHSVISQHGCSKCL